jgi:pimeloyl-ACP methyl ester carboxylesterase
MILFLLTLNINIYAQNDSKGLGNTPKKVWQFIYKKPLSIQPELTEYYWEIERPPFEGPYDKIGLHRVINENAKPKAAVFVCPGTNANTWRFIGNDFIENTIKAVNTRLEKESTNKDELLRLLKDIDSMKQRLIIRFLAANGYDVYGIDYRTHYIQSELEAKDLQFMTHWGWNLFVEDTKEAIEKTKSLSGFDKVFIAGTSFGGMLATTYASKYWKNDLNGIILLDGGNGGRWKLRIPIELWKLVESELTNNIPDLPEWAYTDGKITPKLLQVLIDTFARNVLFKTLKMYAIDMQMSMGPLSDIMPALSVFLSTLGIPFSFGGIPHYNEVTKTAISDPLAEPIDPVTGLYLKPYDEMTGKPFDNYLEWNAEYHYIMPLKGLFTNYGQGYNTPLGLAINVIGNDRFWPLEVYLETFGGMYEFEVTTSNEPIDLLGFKLDLSKIPQAISNAIKELRVAVNSDKKNTIEDSNKLIKNLLNSSYKNIEQNFDYIRNLKNIDVPLISFQSKLGLLFWGPFNPEIKNKDVTNGGEFPFFGHLDTYTSQKNPELVNIPTLKWLNKRVK